jgi:ADP-ribosylglycohydrolase
MWGAVIGDIIGSSFEVENHRSPFFEFYGKGTRFTDDTVCTSAFAMILNNYKLEELNEDLVSNELRVWCCTYLNRGFGSMFYQWVSNGINQPYNSYGNGALMRISPIAKYAIKNNLSLEKTQELANLFTRVTHNHPQALNAVSMYVELLYEFLHYKQKNKGNIPLKEAKQKILDAFIKFKIDLPKKIENYRVTVDFDLTCNTSISIACAAILETDNFDDVMYQVISAGGDSDTYAAIAGALAESIYEIPEYHFDEIRKFFKQYDGDIVESLEKLYM